IFDPGSDPGSDPGADPGADPSLHDRGLLLLRRARTRADRPRMKRVLLLATTTGYQIRSFTDAAQRLGVDIVFASDRCDQLEDPWFDAPVPVCSCDETL